MNIKAVLFDLDGTLLPMDQDLFIKAYFGGLVKKLAPLGYEPNALIDAIWNGTSAMIKNDGSRTNEAVFWDVFCRKMGLSERNDESVFDEFYKVDFQEIQKVCGFDERAAKIVRSLRKGGIITVLATNPVFPAVATESRMRWAGLCPEDFALYTTFENIGYCKPNPAYYTEITKRLGLLPEECVMVGNDVDDDMVAADLGMQVFLLTDCLINKKNADLSAFPHGDFDALARYLEGDRKSVV